jgi:general stress protein 26
MSERGEPQEAWAMLAKFRVAMLTTHEDEQLVSRPMASLAREQDGKIYFITHLKTGKVCEIGESAHVNLAYSDPSKESYVSVAGTATTTQDREKLRELWGFFSEAWLPQGPDDPDTALIEVTPDIAKIWDGNSSALLKGAKMVAAVLRQSPPKTDTIKEVAM